MSIPRALILLFAALFIFFAAAAADAAQAADSFFVRDIEYQTFDGAASLAIETNSHVDYVIYKLDDPFRIVIDPVEMVWCDFEDTVYFNEGMVKSIRFVKGRDLPGGGGPGPGYYPFDFVAVELRYPYPYGYSEKGYTITLDIGKIDGEAQACDDEKLGDARSANHHAGWEQIELGSTPDFGKLRPLRFSPFFERRLAVPWRGHAR